jgi:hypothetical protein
MLGAEFLVLGAVAGAWVLTRELNRMLGDIPSTENAQTDFRWLVLWCEESGQRLRGAYAANRIRGDELKSKDLAELKDRLLNRKIAWPFAVTGISRGGSFVKG